MDTLAAIMRDKNINKGSESASLFSISPLVLLGVIIYRP